ADLSFVVFARLSDRRGGDFAGQRFADDLNWVGAGWRIAGTAILHERQLQVGGSRGPVYEITVEGPRDRGKEVVRGARIGGYASAPAGIPGNSIRERDAIGPGRWKSVERAPVARIFHVDRAAISVGREVAVFQFIGDDLPESCDFVVENQIGARGEEEVAVGMNSASEAEVRAGEIAAIVAAEYAELKHRDERDLNGARHIHRRAHRTSRVHVQGHGNDFGI